LRKQADILHEMALRSGYHMHHKMLMHCRARLNAIMGVDKPVRQKKSAWASDRSASESSSAWSDPQSYWANTPSSAQGSSGGHDYSYRDNRHGSSKGKGKGKTQKGKPANKGKGQNKQSSGSYYGSRHRSKIQAAAQRVKAALEKPAGGTLSSALRLKINKLNTTKFLYSLD
jgi:hypothetical protein